MSKEYIVTFTVTIRGTTIIEADSEVKAINSFLNGDDRGEMPVSWDASCELTDWDAESATENK